MLARAAVFCGFLLLAGLHGGCTSHEEKTSLHLQRGMSLLQSGQPKRAVDEFQLAVRLDPFNRDARYHLGTALLQAGKIREGCLELDRAVALEPDYHEALVKSAEILAAAGLPDAGMERLDRVLAARPDHAAAVLLAMDIHLARGEPEAAEAMAVRVVGAGAAWDLAYQAYARIYGALDQEILAEGALLKSLHHNPAEPNHHRILASYYLQQGRIEEAEKQLLAMTAAFPDLAWPFQELAILNLQEGRTEDAERMLEEIFRRRPPDDESFYLRLAGLFLRQSDPVKAAITIRKAIPLLDQPIGLKSLLADLFFEQQHFEAARKEVREVLGLDRGHGRALLLKAKLLLQEGRRGEALEILDVLSANPHFRGEACYYKAVAHFAGGDLETAEQEAAAAVFSAPEEPRFHALLARLYLLQHRYTAAQEEAAAALELQSTNFRAALVLGESLLHAGEYGRAREILDWILESFPRNLQVLHLKRIALAAGGDQEAAMHALEQILAVDPRYEPALDLSGWPTDPEFGAHGQTGSRPLEP